MKLKLDGKTVFTSGGDLFLVHPLEQLHELFEEPTLELLERVRLDLTIPAATAAAAQPGGSIARLVRFTSEKYSDGIGRLLLCRCGRGQLVSLTIRVIPSLSKPSVP
jgi:hypothetical protein